VLLYSKAKWGFLDLSLNGGLTVNLDQIMIVKEKGILFASPVIKELMYTDSKEGQIMRSGA